MKTWQLFLDLDNVLAAFDAHYEWTFGEAIDRGPGRVTPPNFWTNLAGSPDFWDTIPPCHDALALWHGAKALHPAPIILTGIPGGVERGDIVAGQKRAWVARNIDSQARVICCRTKDKRLHGRHGDTLVDDWPRYRALWEQMGGIFVLHTSAEASLATLREQRAAALQL